MDIGILLLRSGANTERIRTTLHRMAQPFQVKAEIFITHQTIQLQLNSLSPPHRSYYHFKRTRAFATNFSILSGISRMSWRVAEEASWSVEQIRQELQRIESLSAYPVTAVVTCVALSGASFCWLFGGSPLDMLVAFTATLLGQLVHRRAIQMRFNIYLCVYAAALMASLAVIGSSRIFLGVGLENDPSLSASMLFLIPGVPLINTFSDFIDGNILSGLLRGVHGLMVAFSIALGLVTTLLVLGR